MHGQFYISHYPQGTWGEWLILSLRASTASEESEPVFPSLGAPATRKFLYFLSLKRSVAKKRSTKRRFRGTFRQVPVYPTIALSTLGTKDVLAAVLINASTDAYRMLSLDGVWSVTGLTAGEGPVAVGIARGDYTAAEIEEALEAATAVDLGDLIAQERASRMVRQVGICSQQEPILNGGQQMKTKLNWPVAIGDQPKIWAYNLDTGALTTGAEAKFSGKANIVFPQ